MTRPIIFLDLDGPMIPWWGATLPDDTGRDGRIIDGFPFLSRFHPDAIYNLKLIIGATDAMVVTNSTHNKGAAYADGPTHIYNIFKANGIEHVLATEYLSGFKNESFKDWKTRKDRALGIKGWFWRHGINMADTPFVALDDVVGDFESFNRKFPNYTPIPFVEIGATVGNKGGTLDPHPASVISDDDVLYAIDILKDHPNYTGKK